MVCASPQLRELRFVAKKISHKDTKTQNPTKKKEAFVHFSALVS